MTARTERAKGVGNTLPRHTRDWHEKTGVRGLPGDADAVLEAYEPRLEQALALLMVYRRSGAGTRDDQQGTEKNAHRASRLWAGDEPG